MESVTQERRVPADVAAFASEVERRGGSIVWCLATRTFPEDDGAPYTTAPRPTITVTLDGRTYEATAPTYRSAIERLRWQIGRTG